MKAPLRALVVVIVFVSPVELAQPAIARPLSISHCDFDDDGYDDLAVGVPGEDVAGAIDAGAVSVIYGKQDLGLFHQRNQLWWQGEGSIEGVAEEGDAFGAALACGDFNLDGVDDLAIGAPREDVGDQVDAGTVTILHGQEVEGLDSLGNAMWSQDGSVNGAAEAGDLFGTSLAAGDFDDDAIGDLAIGVPGEDIDSIDGTDVTDNAGAVNVLYGTDSGLTAGGDQLWTQDSPSVEGGAQNGDDFGYSIAAGDFDGDGIRDLAIGAPGEGLTAGDEFEASAGGVNILYGVDGAGLSTGGDQFWSQAGAAVRGAPEKYDRFGFSLAAGDFDGDCCDDLAIGVPGEDMSVDGNLRSEAGGVNVLYGQNGSGLAGTGDQFWSQDKAGIKGAAESNDSFGYSIASGDFNGACCDDLAIGVPGEQIGTGSDAKRKAGAINMLDGFPPSGLGSSSDQLLTQDDFTVSSPQEGDMLGSALSAGDFDGDGDDEAVMSVPGELVEEQNGAGLLHVGKGPGTLIYGQHLLDGAPEPFDRFGGEPTSTGIYRIPYEDGAVVGVNRDHLSHTPPTRLDLGGVPTSDEHAIVAAADGWIRSVVDDNSGGDEADNNYVWIEHPNGEWTKYSHMQTGSFPDDIGLGDFVTAGTVLGFEGTVGAPGDHLHWEVAVPDDPANAFKLVGGWVIGQNRIPLICGVPGGLLLDGKTYVAADC